MTTENASARPHRTRREDEINWEPGIVARRPEAGHDLALDLLVAASDSREENVVSRTADPDEAVVVPSLGLRAATREEMESGGR